MAGNVQPVYSRVADIQWVVNCTAANNTADITSGTSYLVWTADATNGGYLRECRVKANPAANTAATVARFWLNNGSTAATDTNTALITEISIPATSSSATTALPDFVAPINMMIPPGYRIYVTFGTAPGGSGEFTVTGVGGKY